MNRELIIGSRGSDLALWQANFVKDCLETHFPGSNIAIKIIRTTGDSMQEVALSKIGDKGLFTRQIEAELLTGSIDLAVHSLKDLQTTQPDGLMIGAVGKREKPNDVLISRKYSSIKELPQGSTVATGSLRRKGQLLFQRPDLKVTEIRGNVPTRLSKFEAADLDGMVLAYAGLHRLGLGSGISHVIPTSEMLPAVGQGAIAIEIREDDDPIIAMTAKLNDDTTSTCIAAERSFLKQLEGGCQVPIGALATIENGSVRLEGMVCSLDGSTLFRDSITGKALEAYELGFRLASSLIEQGADKLLDEARHQSMTSFEPIL